MHTHTICLYTHISHNKYLHTKKTLVEKVTRGRLPERGRVECPGVVPAPFVGSVHNLCFRLLKRADARAFVAKKQGHARMLFHDHVFHATVHSYRHSL
jgi:hypothetical protein